MLPGHTDISLSFRIFLLFGALIAALVGAEWWLVRGLTRDLQEQVGEVALAVGGSVMSLFGTALPAQDGQIAFVYSTGKSGAEFGLPSVFCEPGEAGTIERLTCLLRKDRCPRTTCRTASTRAAAWPLAAFEFRPQDSRRTITRARRCARRSSTPAATEPSPPSCSECRTRHVSSASRSTACASPTWASALAHPGNRLPNWGCGEAFAELPVAEALVHAGQEFARIYTGCVSRKM